MELTGSHPAEDIFIGRKNEHIVAANISYPADDSNHITPKKKKIVRREARATVVIYQQQQPEAVGVGSGGEREKYTPQVSPTKNKLERTGSENVTQKKKKLKQLSLTTSSLPEKTAIKSQMKSLNSVSVSKSGDSSGSKDAKSTRSRKARSRRNGTVGKISKEVPKKEEPKPSTPTTPSYNKLHPYPTLPDKVRLVCEDLNLDRVKIEKYSDYLYNCARFVMKECWIDEKTPLVVESQAHRKVPYAPQELLDLAESELQIPTKPWKKIYKSHGDAVGKGGFGSVIIVKPNVSGSSAIRYAAKRLPHDSDRNIQSNITEIAFLNFCKGHPNIVQYHESYLVSEKREKPEAWIIMEYLQGGTLREAAKSRLFTDIHIAYVAREVLKGLEFLHSKNIAHRDLKSANIMMSIKGEIKLIDLGLCADFTAGPRVKMLGSPYWIPPEMIHNKPHSCPVDMWSFAVCLLELYNGEPPFSPSSLKCMFTAATDGLSSQIPANATANAKDFLEKCLQIDPNDRAKPGDLLQHPWVKQTKIGKGIVEVLKQIFLSNSLIHMGF
jgi:hypothetical protein